MKHVDSTEFNTLFLSPYREAESIFVCPKKTKPQRIQGSALSILNLPGMIPFLGVVWITHSQTGPSKASFGQKHKYLY